MKQLNFHLFFLLLVGCLSVIKADSAYKKYGPTLKALTSCQRQLSNTAVFCTTGKTRGNKCICTNPNALATAAGCLSYGHRNTTAIFKALFASCEAYNVTLTVDDMVEAYQNYTKYAIHASDIPNFNAKSPVHVPIRLNDTNIRLYMEAYDKYLGNYDNSLYYSVGVIGYWALVFLVAIIVNWSQVLFPGFFKILTGPISNKFRKHITMPAAFGKKKTTEHKVLKIFHFLMPSRFETIVIIGFLAVVIAVCSAQISYVEGDPVFDSKSSALLRYTADRTGIVATIIMPLLILFAGRNNFLQWLTKWNFATFITYHKWVARVDFTLVVVHAICFSASYGDYYTEVMKRKYMKWGYCCNCSRRNNYEVFLTIHIIFAALWIAGTWIHVQDLGYVWFVYPSAALWVLDRAVRIFRLICFGFPEAQITLLFNETLKVVVPKPKYWNSVPGGHAFIHFIRPTCFWQSHPFTFTNSVQEGDQIVLYCKVKGGITHGLNKYIASHPGRTARVRVGVEGPYGEPTNAKIYDTAVFIAGGNGIPGLYSEAVDMALRSKENNKQVIKLIWIIRENKSLLWFYEELLALSQTKIQCTVYVTKPKGDINNVEYNEVIKLSSRISQSENDSTEEVDKKEKSKYVHEKTEVEFEPSDSEANSNIGAIKSEFSHIEFREGRPTIEDIVDSEVKESNGSIAFVTCGHPMMVDEVRYSVIEQVDKSDGKRIEYFEQLQVWA
ncbi:ferric reductase NAD binding domain-containing protein [Scheffersomyces coipomensis]|uniref:ferric reductase NAD binding domain-containing protein n=1 Tax=Scheffersomyces coipomensis TaxID=1788519 RepID=UPI00315D031B